jgi:VWFA-related protein
MPRWRVATAAAALAVLGVTALPAQQPQQPTPTFRTRTTLRPIEVRVVDQRGRPISGLRQQDFTIQENGNPQEIKLFTAFDLTAAPPDSVGEPALVRAGTRPDDLLPSTRRVFLIVLGRGNLQIPSKGIDGMIHLVRNLLPQDLVAVMAWNRATPFTTDHEQIAAMLERYRDGHKQVEAMLAQHFSGLAAIYGNRDIPEQLTKDIDAVLRGSDAPPTHTILPSAVSTAAIDARVRRDTDILQTQAIRGDSPSLDVFGPDLAEQIGMSLDEYVLNRVASMQDLTRIHAGLAYLRYVEGDKHMVVVSQGGLGLPSTDDDRSLARLAQDARVAINIFRSGGVGGGWGETWSIASSQNVAEFTGGQYTGLTYGDRFAARLETATRSGYQLGYEPSDPTLDGKYRKVTVKVNRRGARVLYQQGYYARDEFTVFDRRAVISQSRVEAALRYPQPVDDLKLDVTATAGRAPDGRHQMTVQVNVDPANLHVTSTGFDRFVSLDVAVFCVDRRQLVGYVWRRINVRLDDNRYAEFLKSGLGFTVIVPLRRTSKQVKAVVYDYAADRIGTAVPAVK